MQEIAERKVPKIVVAGHICLDITPVFRGKKANRIEEAMVPGHLIQVGAADVHVGGIVANTGLALKLMGADVVLMGKVGKDLFGELILSQVGKYGDFSGMRIDDTVNTSYSVVIAPKGIDRIFLHHPGANDVFSIEDLNFSKIKESQLFHFGYPPLMKRMYVNDGEELVKIFQKVKEMGIATSLDMAAVDPDTDAGNANWKMILRGVLPFVDFFEPSAEELAYMIDRKIYNEWVQRAEGRDLIDVIEITEIEYLAKKLLEWGAKIVLIKCGAKGIYFAANIKKELEKISLPVISEIVKWEKINFFECSYKPEQVLSGTGAGDTSIAAFLYAVTKGCTCKECVQIAAAAGASCVEGYDALSGLKSFEELRARIRNGWEKTASIME